MDRERVGGGGEVHATGGVAEAGAIPPPPPFTIPTFRSLSLPAIESQPLPLLQQSFPRHVDGGWEGCGWGQLWRRAGGCREGGGYKNMCGMRAARLQSTLP